MQKINVNTDFENYWLYDSKSQNMSRKEQQSSLMSLLSFMRSNLVHNFDSIFEAKMYQGSSFSKDPSLQLRLIKKYIFNVAILNDGNFIIEEYFEPRDSHKCVNMNDVARLFLTYIDKFVSSESSMSISQAEELLYSYTDILELNNAIFTIVTAEDKINDKDSFLKEISFSLSSLLNQAIESYKEDEIKYYSEIIKTIKAIDVAYPDILRSVEPELAVFRYKFQKVVPEYRLFFTDLENDLIDENVLNLFREHNYIVLVEDGNVDIYNIESSEKLKNPKQSEPSQPNLTNNIVIDISEVLKKLKWQPAGPINMNITNKTIETLVINKFGIKRDIVLYKGSDELFIKSLSNDLSNALNLELVVS